jgi:type I restriction enzyme S subunit
MAVDSADLGTGRTGGRDATTGVIPGRLALSVGKPGLNPPKGWKWTALSDVAQLESGHTPNRKHPEYWDGGIPWIGIKDATENHGRTISNTFQHVSALGLENSSARLLPANTVCLSRTASVGFVVVMGRSMATSQDFVNWVCGPNIEPHYLKYVLLAENEALWRFASGTTHQTIYYPEAKAFHVCLPPVAEQKAIAQILGALDDKIELNRRMNATLEAMARALFQSWFVDFDPVRAKLDGRPPAALDHAAGGLFPEHLEDSTIGKKPIGWEVTPLEAALSVLETGGRPKGGVGGILSGIPSIGAESIVGVGRFDFGKTKFVPVEFYDGMRKGHIESHDVLIYKDGGRPGEYEPHVSMFVNGFPFEKCCINEHVYRLRANQRLSQEYLYFWLSSDLVFAEMRIKGTGVAIPGLNSTAVRSLPVLVPPRPVVNAFTRQAAPVITRLIANSRESRTLATLRDTLLPKLLSGKIRAKN